MKRLSVMACLSGVLHISFFAWATWIARWQNKNLLARVNALESFDVAIEIFYERMHTAFMVSAALGLLMLGAAYLLHGSKAIGWRVWLASLILGITAATYAIVQSGLNGGSLLRLIFLAVMAYATYRIKQSFEPKKSAAHDPTP